MAQALVLHSTFQCTKYAGSCGVGLNDKAEIEAQMKIVLKMADDVEAELETPEALEIAKEDILLSKMDEERER